MIKIKDHRKEVFPLINTLQFSLISLGLSSCGASKSNEVVSTKLIGFSSSYRPPSANYDPPINKDPYFKKFEPILDTPYWISALEMDNGYEVINKLLIDNNNVFTFSFPSETPIYLPITIIGWAPANQNTIAASREIFSKLENILNVTIIEAEISTGHNNLSISQSIQANSAGFSYFPNNFYKLGSDVFISKDYSDPKLFSNERTNYDYEVLLHEIGHALGLKHPFEEDGNNLITLNNFEDKTEFTAMSYNDDPNTFDGMFRVLDLMSLTKFYGVNQRYKAADDSYTFNEDIGTFIIDGNGIDEINAKTSLDDVYIDLRPGAHSYMGKKSEFITSGGQLTISHNSKIENVITGNGNDTVIGNDLSNYINTSAGNDVIFAGDGKDIINSGYGIDIIDLSEEIQFTDKVILNSENELQNFDTIYGFIQGISGDIIDLTNLNLKTPALLPLVDASSPPEGYIDNCVVRVFGENLNDPVNLEEHFKPKGKLESLKFSENSSTLLIAANSQSTGESQNVFSISNSDGNIETVHMLHLIGNNLDIDNWSSDNFIFV